MYGGQERCIEFSVGKPEGRNHLEDLDVNIKMILK